MVESRKYNLGDQLDIEQILLEAQSRWLRPAEICEILQNHQKFHIAPEPPNRPPNGSLFLFDRKVLRYFRKDGHNWRKKKDGKTVKEAHERLKAGSVDVLHCYYAHGEENENFQRRSYWMLEEHLMHIVLVHYREVKGSKTSFGFPPNAEGASSSRMSSPVSSATNGNQVASSTDTTSLNSAQTSEYEDTESESHQASSAYRSFVELSQSENRSVAGHMNTGFMNSFFPASSPSAHCDFHGTQLSNSGLDFVPLAQEHRTAPFRPSVSSGQSSTMDISQLGNMIFGQPLAYEVHNEQIAFEDDSSHISKWPMEQKLHTDSGLDLDNSFHGHKAYYSAQDPSYTNTEQKKGHHLQNDLQVQFSDVEVGSLLKYLENDLTVDGNINNPLTAKKSLLASSRADSFDRWMSKELGEVDESHMQSSSRFYWNSEESEDVVNDTSMSPQLNLDAYLLSPSLSRDQLFSIIDFSPNWAYTSSETKVLITGNFLKSPEDVAKCKWSCMFGAVEVPAEVLGDSILRCHAPLHKAGRVPFYVTCSNRLACSVVREFEYRDDYLQDSNMSGCYSGSDMLLHIRFGKLLSLGSVRDLSISTSTSEKHHISGKVSSFTKEDDNEWFHMIKMTSEEEFYPGKMKEQLLQKMFKHKLQEWLFQKTTEEDDKGLTVLDKEGQGALHLAAALNYDWAIAPAVATGVSINFRDINGWTALHWAAFYGREKTVGALVSMGAAPGALTDPTPEFPTGRTPADLASENGHKGIAGYLAESSLTTHLSALNLKDTKDSNPEISGVNAVQTISERSATQDNNFDAPDASLKDSLTAVCNATQAAARIHQVFRVQSFHHKRLIEYGDDKIKMSDEKALSLISVKTNRPGHHDEPVHSAAIRIQNKFRGWKGRKEFMVVRQRIVKIQAHVRGHQVRNRYKPIIWSVGIVEKVILRWRRKGSGLRGFRSEPTIEGPATSCTSKEDDYDFLKQGKKQTEQRLQKALARVKSMVQYPEARDQYHRLLTVVTEFREAKDVHDDMVPNSSEETGDEDLINLEALLDDDTFMSTTWGE